MFSRTPVLSPASQVYYNLLLFNFLETIRFQTIFLNLLYSKSMKEFFATIKNTRNQKPNKQKSDDNKVNDKNNESTSIAKLSNEDKQILLEALQKYGSQNIGAISNMLPSVPFQDITSILSEYSKIAEHLCKNKLLDKWLNCGLYQPGDSVIPEALLFIQLFEDHPLPSELEGHDIRAIYNFLYRSCFEQVSYFDLSSKDRDLLCFLLSKVEQEFWPTCQMEFTEYANKIYKGKNIKKVYPGKNKNSL